MKKLSETYKELGIAAMKDEETPLERYTRDTLKFYGWAHIIGGLLGLILLLILCLKSQ